MENKEDKQCVEEVWHNWSKYQCERKGNYKVGGKWYCWQHKPKEDYEL